MKPFTLSRRRVLLILANYFAGYLFVYPMLIGLLYSLLEPLGIKHLQPILENSIIHGTECKLGTGHIRILLEMTESCLLLCISDDGNGMEERKVADINERLQKSGGILATGESETKGGIALVNVNNRIHLLFGEEYGIHVYSMPEIGTDVKIRIPVIYSDRNLIHMEERQENYC